MRPPILASPLLLAALVFAAPLSAQTGTGQGPRDRELALQRRAATHGWRLRANRPPRDTTTVEPGCYVGIRRQTGVHLAAGMPRTAVENALQSLGQRDSLRVEVTDAGIVTATRPGHAPMVGRVAQDTRGSSMTFLEHSSLAVRIRHTRQVSIRAEEWRPLSNGKRGRLADWTLVRTTDCPPSAAMSARR